MQKIAPEIAAKIGASRPAPSDELELERLEQEIIDSANREPGNLEGEYCSLCMNRGFMHVMEDGYHVVRECSCMARRRSERRMRISGLSDLTERYTFESWQMPERWQKLAKNVAESYADEKKGWLLAVGRSGSGKTHLCTAVCKTLIEDGIEARYVLWRDLTTKAKALLVDASEYARLIEPLKSVPLLYIDDLFKTGKGQQPTTADVNLAFEILNARYNDSKKLTILSSELRVEDLLDLDEALGSRIYERSKRYYLNFSDKPNWRLRNT